MPNSPNKKAAPLLAFGAHPDDIEFGCGGIAAVESLAGRAAHFVVCSRGESGTNGTPRQRTAEAEKSAKLLGATLEWVELDGDAHLEIKAAHAIKLAAVIRRKRPVIILAPSPADNQHPDHARLGRLTRDAARLARYGGVKELRGHPPHSIGQLLFYAMTLEAEPHGISAVLVDVSAPKALAAWSAAMKAHASQAGTRDYAELQLMRARLRGQRAGIGHAMALFPNDPPVFNSLTPLENGARFF